MSKKKDIIFYRKLFKAITVQGGPRFFTKINELYLFFISIKKLLFLDKSKQLERETKVFMTDGLSFMAHLFLEYDSKYQEFFFPLLKKDKYDPLIIQDYIFDIYKSLEMIIESVEYNIQVQSHLIRVLVALLLFGIYSNKYSFYENIAKEYINKLCKKHILFIKNQKFDNEYREKTLQDILKVDKNFNPEPVISIYSNFFLEYQNNKSSIKTGIVDLNNMIKNNDDYSNIIKKISYIENYGIFYLTSNVNDKYTFYLWEEDDEYLNINYDDYYNIISKSLFADLLYELSLKIEKGDTEDLIDEIKEKIYFGNIYLYVLNESKISIYENNNFILKQIRNSLKIALNNDSINTKIDNTNILDTLLKINTSNSDEDDLINISIDETQLLKKKQLCYNNNNNNAILKALLEIIKLKNVSNDQIFYLFRHFTIQNEKINFDNIKEEISIGNKKFKKKNFKSNIGDFLFFILNLEDSEIDNSVSYCEDNIFPIIEKSKIIHNSTKKIIPNANFSTILQMVEITNHEEKKNKSKQHIFKTLFNFIKNNKFYINITLTTSICSAFLYYYYDFDNIIGIEYTIQSLKNWIPFVNLSLNEFDNHEIQQSIMFCDVLGYQQEQVFGNSYENGYKISSAVLFNRIAQLIIDFKQNKIKYDESFVDISGINFNSINYNLNKKKLNLLIKNNSLYSIDEYINVQNIVLLDDYVPIGKMIKLLDEYYSAKSVKISTNKLKILTYINNMEHTHYLISNPIKLFGLIFSNIMYANAKNYKTNNLNILNDLIYIK